MRPGCADGQRKWMSGAFGCSSYVNWRISREAQSWPPSAVTSVVIDPGLTGSVKGSVKKGGSSQDS